jgi:hypothetical protein
MPIITAAITNSVTISRRRGEPTRNRERRRGCGALTRRRVLERAPGALRSSGLRRWAARGFDGEVFRSLGVLADVFVPSVDRRRFGARGVFACCVDRRVGVAWRRVSDVPCERAAVGLTVGLTASPR